MMAVTVSSIRVRAGGMLLRHGGNSTRECNVKSTTLQTLIEDAGCQATKGIAPSLHEKSDSFAEVGSELGFLTGNEDRRGRGENG